MFYAATEIDSKGENDMSCPSGSEWNIDDNSCSTNATESDWTVDKNHCSDTDTEESYEKEDPDSETEQQSEHDGIDDNDKIGDTRCQQARRPATIVLDNNVNSRHIAE
ncbi:hypothetical protein DPMN_143311 [Dreissena polymorpha]|uniref:Uncharacterized protein n=1 Tax=Dreissena polymorpha TaxID=45954 RepID=A0A9D4GG50_DREPO|nr:hypothetical protein DPMN_143311 [Dreissena polymorpha]